MKRLAIVVLLSTASAQALDLEETWKTINSYRLTSAAKAFLVAGAVLHVSGHAYKHFNGDHGFTAVVKGNEPVKQGFEQAVLTVALGYAAVFFSIDHFWPNVKHALAIK